MKTTQILGAFAASCLLAASLTGSVAGEPGRSIEVHAHRFAFEPAEITVHKGETVSLKLITDDVPHSLLISDLKINETTTKSHPAEFQLTPDTVGDFHGRCGRFCGSGHGQMTFTVHVVAN